MGALNVERTRAAWGGGLPDEVLILAEECDRPGASQARVGQRIGYSGSVVNAVLRCTYRGDLDAVKQAIRGRFMSEEVECPVLGKIAANRCHDFQRKPLSAANPANAKVHRACRDGCPNSRLGRQS